MEMLRLSKTVRRVVRLERDPSGQPSPVVIYKAKGRKKKKKGSFGLSALDEAIRRSVNAQRSFLDSYSSRHSRSGKKKRDGWALDLGQNLVRAGRRGAKRLRLNRLPVPRPPMM